MEFSLNRINPNQTQVIFSDGRFETLTNEELEHLMLTETFDGGSGKGEYLDL
ncbi:hypothetical protein [Bacillus sp. M6-12]|uniref:hypothetical protein n=1 Tax=Bacillus sp. M6-12 TaxID=2054166 RepID=UPI0015E152E4|nr:hypothetical protein [Bacillus sp. M6-12]